MADALASGASEGNLVGVQVPPSPTEKVQVIGYFLTALGADFYRISTGSPAVCRRTLVSVTVQPTDGRPEAPRALTREDIPRSGSAIARP